MDELFSMIGKLYVELINMQKYIETLRTEIKEKDNKIAELQSVETNERS